MDFSTSRTRNDLLFTMSDNTRPPCAGWHERWTREVGSITDERIPAGGARRDRTDDLLLAKQALSQLS
jgi:hypothetical protein